MSENIQTVAALVAIAGAAVALITWLWRKRILVLRLISRERAAVDEVARKADAEQFETLVEQVAQRARALGVVLAVRGEGNAIINTNGERITYIRDHAVYQAKMQAGTVDRFRTWPGERPTALSERSREWLITWLEEHPLDG